MVPKSRAGWACLTLYSSRQAKLVRSVYCSCDEEHLAWPRHRRNASQLSIPNISHTSLLHSERNREFMKEKL